MLVVIAVLVVLAVVVLIVIVLEIVVVVLNCTHVDKYRKCMNEHSYDSYYHCCCCLFANITIKTTTEKV